MNKSNHFALILIILANLLIGVWIVTDYGESWDEHLRYRYAERSLAAYRGEGAAPLDEKGPFYVMAATLASQGLRRLTQNLTAIQAWHFIHFLSFLSSLVFLYLLGLHFMSQRMALFTVLLFNTQPLLWGHAWINPKDMPFMAFFLGSTALGMRMVEAFKSPPSAPDLGYAPQFPGFSNRRKISTVTGAFLAILSLAAFAVLLVLTLGKGYLLGILSDEIHAAFAGEPGGLLGGWLTQMMTNRQSVPAEAYIGKITTLYPRFVWSYAGILLGVTILLAAWFYPRLTDWFWKTKLRPFLLGIFSSLRDRRIWIAGIMLGFCSATRVLGPFSGLLVALYALQTTGRHAIPKLISYFSIAILVTVLVWPGLWSSPVRNYLYSFSQASDFPWEGKVMFAGQDYAVDALPRTYLPVLLALQFTETSLMPALLGLSLAVIRFFRNNKDRARLAILLAWLIVPVVLAIWLQPTMYDNFRQFLFIVPPIFIMAGIGVEYLLQHLRRPLWAAALCAALLLPGLYWLVQLHPYQYTYYNAIVGNVSGAFRYYELDYWATSYQEAAFFLNGAAPQGARVVVWGADHLIQNLARPDLQIIEYRKAKDQSTSAFDYAVILTRHSKDLTLYPDAPVVLSIGRSGAIFSVVKQLAGDHSP